jgi:hypothetical protein
MSPNAGGREGCGVSANEYSCALGGHINFEDLTPYGYHEQQDLVSYPTQENPAFACKIDTKN